LQKGLELEERDYFKEPISRDELQELASLASLTDLFAWRSPSFKKMGLDAGDVSEAEMLRLMLEEPRLLRRPVTRVGDKLIIGGSPKLLEQELAGLE
jgi:arsenate reductase-like glutaredoxin family protein